LSAARIRFGFGFSEIDALSDGDARRNLGQESAASIPPKNRLLLNGESINFHLLNSCVMSESNQLLVVQVAFT
jgi:hypothetical protein